MSEAEALYDMEDEFDDSWKYDRPGYYEYVHRTHKCKKTKSYINRDKAGRKATLNTDIENLRTANKEAVVKSECVCPICKRPFIKRTYQQTFCSGECHDKYHTLRYK